MIGRRALLQRLGIGAVAAPIAAKRMLEDNAAKLAGVATHGTGAFAQPAGGPAGEAQPAQAFPYAKHLRSVLQNETHRAAFESMMYERCRYVGFIDADLVNKQSFSLAAKIAFQRQRNVARQIAEDQSDTPYWNAPAQLVKRLSGWPL